MSDPKKFVTEIEISLDSNRMRGFLPSDSMRTAMESADEGNPAAFVVNKSLVSFVANVGSQNRMDVLNSTLLAQLAANKKFPDEKNLVEWFRTYADVLSKIGWVLAGKDFVNVETSKNLFEVENVVLDILGASLGGNAMAIITKTIEAFRKLSNADGRLVAFEKNTHTSEKGTFLIASADETNGVVSLSMAGFVVSSTEQIQRILFFKSTKEKTALQVATRTGTLNTDTYGLVRNDILTKLGITVNEFIADLEI